MCDEFEDADTSEFEDADTSEFEIENNSIMNDFHVEKFDDNVHQYMHNLLANDDLTSEKQEELTAEFNYYFKKQYPQSKLNFYQGSLDDALKTSIRNLENPRPLMLYIRDNSSVYDNLFCVRFFQSDEVVECLNENYVLWPWDRTNKLNDEKFLGLLIDKLGYRIASKIPSTNSPHNDKYPLLICLYFQNSRYNILGMINNETRDDKFMSSQLISLSEDFLKINDPISSLNVSEIFHWYIPASSLTRLSTYSSDFENIAASIGIKAGDIVTIDEINDPICSVQYQIEKRKLDNQRSECIRIHCSETFIEKILSDGFDENQRLIVASKTNGFHISTFDEFTDQNLKPASSYRAIIKCEQLISHDNSERFFRMKQILPQFIIIYKSESL